MEEFVPLDEFTQLFRRWWVVAVCIFLGGLIAFGFHLLNPPVFEASASILATIDVQSFPFQNVREDLIQYNEDLALGTVEGVLRSAEITQQLIITTNALGVPLNLELLANNSTIERRNAIWEIRYRSSDPSAAQLIVNQWVQLGYAAMQVWKSDGRIPIFVLIEPPTPAILPMRPIAYQLNNLLLAGSLSGLLVGILLTGILTHKNSTLNNDHEDINP